MPAISEDQRREDAFSRYVLPEIAVLARVARSLTHHAADAEDLVQETLLSAYRSIDRFDGEHPRAWLLTIMRNAKLKRHRRRRPRLLREGEPVEHWSAMDPMYSSDSPEQLVVGHNSKPSSSPASRLSPNDTAKSSSSSTLTGSPTPKRHR